MKHAILLCLYRQLRQYPIRYPLWMRDSSYEPVGTAVCRSHHLWYSRALNDLFLANYGLQGLYALILKGNFIANKNYYEDFVDSYSWWPTH